MKLINHLREFYGFPQAVLAQYIGVNRGHLSMAGLPSTAGLAGKDAALASDLFLRCAGQFVLLHFSSPIVKQRPHKRLETFHMERFHYV